MRTRTQLLFSVLGLTLFISLPVLAEKKPTEGSNTTPPSVEQRVPTTPNPAVQEQEKPASSTEAASERSNLVDTAASNNEFQTLAKAIKAAGLEETLAAEGPYTVFAPTDAAFAALPPGILDQLLLPENKEILVALLKSHVVSGAVTSSQIQPGNVNVETLAGPPVTVQRAEDGTVTVNNAKVTQADIQASNGVIHAIDKVILPQDAQSQSQTAPKPSGQSQK